MRESDPQNMLGLVLILMVIELLAVAALVAILWLL